MATIDCGKMKYKSKYIGNKSMERNKSKLTSFEKA